MHNTYVLKTKRNMSKNNIKYSILIKMNLHKLCTFFNNYNTVRFKYCVRVL